MNAQLLINYTFLWEKLTAYAKSAGRTAARPILLLYFVMKSSGTPKVDRLLIVSALSYPVLPIDLISAKRLPIIGWIDEIAAIAYAYKKVCKHITPEIERKVENLLTDWFPIEKYEIIR